VGKVISLECLRIVSLPFPMKVANDLAIGGLSSSLFVYFKVLRHLSIGTCLWTKKCSQNFIEWSSVGS